MCASRRAPAAKAGASPRRVLLGFARAKYDTVLCMDADLQHEPESVPDVAAPVLAGRADFSVGSRHVGGGGVGFEWNLVRVIISAGATLLARPLCTSTDPMSGFFCTTKHSWRNGEPRPLGFKVGLEVMVRCRCTTVEDVPITFRERTAGESKLSAKQNVEYLQQLAGLYWFALRYEVLAAFCLGGSGCLRRVIGILWCFSPYLGLRGGADENRENPFASSIFVRLRDAARAVSQAWKWRT